MSHLKRKLTEWIRPTTGETAATGQGMLSENYIEYQFRAMTGSWERLRPIWLMLTVNSLTESDVKTFGVPVLDLYLSRQAVRLGKRTGAVESVLEQCEPLNRLNHTKVGTRQSIHPGMTHRHYLVILRMSRYKYLCPAGKLCLQ